MAAAMEAVRGGSGINRAADEHGVPRTTLKDRVSGRVAEHAKPGPRPYLVPSEERQLAEHLVKAANLGYGKTKRQIQHMVERVAKEKGTLKRSRISDGWWRRFLERNPQLRLRRGDATGHERMDALNKENLDAYFQLLQDVYDEFNFHDHPELIYNMDETGMPLDVKPPKIVARKGQKKVRC